MEFQVTQDIPEVEFQVTQDILEVEFPVTLDTAELVRQDIAAILEPAVTQEYPDTAVTLEYLGTQEAVYQDIREQLDQEYLAIRDTVEVEHLVIVVTQATQGSADILATQESLDTVDLEFLDTLEVEFLDTLDTVESAAIQEVVYRDTQDIVEFLDTVVVEFQVTVEAE